MLVAVYGGRINHVLRRSIHHRPCVRHTHTSDLALPAPKVPPTPHCEFLLSDLPRYRLAQQGASALSDAELLTIITGVPCRETAQRLLIAAGGLRGLQALSTVELQQLVAGISTGCAAQFKAAIELGTRVARGEHLARKQIKSPADVAELLLLKLYLAVVLNLCARRVVGWSMQPTLERKLVLAALERAVRRRQPAR